MPSARYAGLARPVDMLRGWLERLGYGAPRTAPAPPAPADVIRASPLFDEAFYRAQFERDLGEVDWARHYLDQGERAGFKPSLRFNPEVYAATHADVARDEGNRLLHFELFGRSEGRSITPLLTDQARAEAALVRASPLFDERYYAGQLSEQDRDADLAIHYVTVGEPGGLHPSPGFDPEIYGRRYVDVVNGGLNRLAHYEAFGRAEGRRCVALAGDVNLPAKRIQPGRQTVLILLHEATYTGAPILGWNIARELDDRYNVVIVLRREGDLLAAFCDYDVVGPLDFLYVFEDEMEAVGRRIAERYQPLYAIANSVETTGIMRGLDAADVPIVGLVHEFASHSQPLGVLQSFHLSCDHVVFSAPLVLDASQAVYPLLKLKSVHILPQGRSQVPRRPRGEDVVDTLEFRTLLQETDRPRAGFREIFDRPRGEGPFTVVGMGGVDLRKGVDLFIATATALAAMGERDFRFVWVGDYRHMFGSYLGIAIEEQIVRSGVADRLHLLPATDDLAPALAGADAFLLSSRLDPLPNVAIDAAFAGVPVVCFEGATGFADLLKARPETHDLVAPYLDTGAAARAIARLIREPDRRAAASLALTAIAAATFDMTRYVDQLDQLGRDAAATAAEREGDDEASILAASIFDKAFYLGRRGGAVVSQEAGVRAYVLNTRKLDLAAPTARGFSPRRPVSGFNPAAYARLAPGAPRAGERTMLADFLRRGRPVGPWVHDVLAIDGATDPSDPAPVRAALHGHFHYTDNIDDLLAALSANRTPLDLFLTTTSQTCAEQLARATASYSAGDVQIETGENAGRDIGPFLRLLQEGVLDRYDVVGHLHGKRSAHTAHYDPSLGDRWRVFLWEHLVGPARPVADIILQAFAADPGLGLVFPENQDVVGWERNRPIAEALAARMSLGPLPEDIEFPVGTMFWVRPKALAPLATLGLRTCDYPAEPASIDGTVLHALERLLPSISFAQGYRYATTYTARFSRDRQD